MKSNDLHLGCNRGLLGQVSMDSTSEEMDKLVKRMLTAGVSYRYELYLDCLTEEVDITTAFEEDTKRLDKGQRRTRTRGSRWSNTHGPSWSLQHSCRYMSRCGGWEDGSTHREDDGKDDLEDIATGYENEPTIRVDLFAELVQSESQLYSLKAMMDRHELFLCCC